MKRTIGFALASGLAFLVAGCAGTGGGAGAPAGGGGASGSGGGANNQAIAAATGVRDFNLQVKCPGIHLEKSKLKWDDDKIMAHENVTPEEIASCEAFTAAQPKGYVPPPPGGAAMVGNATMPGPGGQPYSGPGSAGQGSTGAALGNQPQGNH
jgi:hypothetical protein